MTRKNNIDIKPWLEYSRPLVRILQGIYDALDDGEGIPLMAVIQTAQASKDVDFFINQFEGLKEFADERIKELKKMKLKN